MNNVTRWTAAVILLSLIPGCSSRRVAAEDAGPDARPDLFDPADAAVPDLRAPDLRAADLPSPDLFDPLPDYGPAPDVAACTPLAFTPVNNPAFTGNDSWCGVKGHAVIDSAAKEAAHISLYCKLSPGCQLTCPPPTTVDYANKTLLYAFDKGATVGEVIYPVDVLDCGSHLRMLYKFKGGSISQAVEMTWTSVLVDRTALPVYFIRKF